MSLLATTNLLRFITDDDFAVKRLTRTEIVATCKLTSLQFYVYHSLSLYDIVATLYSRIQTNQQDV